MTSIPLLAATSVTFAAYGYFVAGLSTALGVGASLFIVPALLMFLPALGVNAEGAPAVAVATSLAASCLMSLAGAWAHWRAGNLTAASLQVARRPLLSAAIGSAIGGTVLAGSSSATGLAAVAQAQLVVAIALLARLRSTPSVTQPGLAPADARECARVLQDGRTCRFTACVGALTSIGAGGVFFVPYFTSRGVTRPQAAAFASLLGVAIAPCATAVYFARSQAFEASELLGLVHWPIAAAIACGALFGATKGASSARALSSRSWTWLLFAILLASSARAASKLL